MSRIPDVRLTVSVSLDVDGARYEATHVSVPGWGMHADAECLHILDKAAYPDTPPPDTIDPTEGECLASVLLRDWQKRFDLDGQGSKQFLDGLLKRIDEKRQEARAKAREAAAKQPNLPGVSK